MAIKILWTLVKRIQNKSFSKTYGEQARRNNEDIKSVATLVNEIEEDYSMSQDVSLISSKLSFQALFVSIGGGLGASSRYLLNLLSNNLPH